MSSAEFQVSICRQLGLALPSAISCPTSGCNLKDDFGDHAITCSNGGDMITRHTNIRNLIILHLQVRKL